MHVYNVLKMQSHLPDLRLHVGVGDPNQDGHAQANGHRPLPCAGHGDTRDQCHRKEFHGHVHPQVLHVLNEPAHLKVEKARLGRAFLSTSFGRF